LYLCGEIKSFSIWEIIRIQNLDNQLRNISEAGQKSEN
jgi:hypothetical protein